MIKQIKIAAFCSAILMASIVNTAVADEQIQATPSATFLQTDPGLSLLPSIKEAEPVVVAVKVGVVDLNRISSESATGKAAQQKIKAEQTRLQKQIDSKRKMMEQLRTDLEKQMPNLHPMQRDTKQREFQKKVEEFQKFGLQSEQKLAEQQQKLTQELFASIAKVAAELGEEKGLQVVVVNRELMFWDKSVELVELDGEIIQRLDAGSKKK